MSGLGRKWCQVLVCQAPPASYYSYVCTPGSPSLGKETLHSTICCESTLIQVDRQPEPEWWVMTENMSRFRIRDLAPRSPSKSKSELHQKKKITAEMCSAKARRCPIEVKPSSHPISIPKVTETLDESVSRLTQEYDCATWNMYNRIMHHRRMNMKLNPTSFTLSHFLEPKVEGGIKSDESNNQEIVKTQQECYCRDTDCLQFQMEDD
eukprot:scaffold8157_cov136-Skeletonema_menzelii.AAC.4